jgi:hypothetical protein
VQQRGAPRLATTTASSSSSSGSTVAVKTSRGNLLLLCDSRTQMIWAEQLQLRRPQLMLLLLHLQW